MKHEFSLDGPDGDIVVHPAIPAGLSDQQQIDLVIQKLELARVALKDGKEVSLQKWLSCAFCVAARPGGCYDCIVVKKTGATSEFAPGMATFHNLTSSKADRLAGVKLLLAELHKYKECFHEDNQHPD